MTKQNKTNWVEKDKQQLHPVYHPKSHANPLVIERGEGETLHREVPQLLERGARLEPAGCDVGEQRLQLLGAHATRTSGSARSR